MAEIRRSTAVVVFEVGAESADIGESGRLSHRIDAEFGTRKEQAGGVLEPQLPDVFWERLICAALGEGGAYAAGGQPQTGHQYLPVEERILIKMLVADHSVDIFEEVFVRHILWANGRNGRGICGGLFRGVHHLLFCPNPVHISKIRKEKESKDDNGPGKAFQGHLCRLQLFEHLCGLAGRITDACLCFVGMVRSGGEGSQGTILDCEKHQDDDKRPEPAV